jgi:hypothetical protein
MIPVICEIHHWRPFDGVPPGYIRNATAIIAPMEADRLNLIENSLQDLAARSAELRRYL